MKKGFWFLLLALGLLFAFYNSLFAKDIPFSSGFRQRSSSTTTTTTTHSSSIFSSSPKKQEPVNPASNYNRDSSYYINPYYDYCSSWGEEIRSKILNNLSDTRTSPVRFTVSFTINDNGSASDIKFWDLARDTSFRESIISAIKKSEPFERRPDQCQYNSVTLDF